MQTIEVSFCTGIEDVTIENQEDTAVITIKLKTAPKKLITKVTVNPSNTNFLQAVIKDWGYVCAPKEVLTYDTTIYRRVKLPNEYGTIKNINYGLAYRGIEEIRINVEERDLLVKQKNSSIQYSVVEELRQNVTEENKAVRITSHGINYEQVAPSPI